MGWTGQTAAAALVAVATAVVTGAEKAERMLVEAGGPTARAEDHSPARPSPSVARQSVPEVDLDSVAGAGAAHLVVVHLSPLPLKVSSEVRNGLTRKEEAYRDHMHDQKWDVSCYSQAISIGNLWCNI